MARPPHLSPVESDLAYASAQKVVEAHRRLADSLRVGQTLAGIDAFVARTLADLDCRSCFLGYRVSKLPAFPSHACLSVNNCIVHGTAGYYREPMKPGDVLKVDIGVTFRGWIGDAAWTYVFREASPEVRRLMQSGKESLAAGVQQLRPPKTFLAWATAVQSIVEGKYGFHLVRGLGGHGYGRRLHGPPFISNVAPSYPGEWPDAFTPCEPGVLVAVEPMIAVGTAETVHRKGEWPVFSGDGSMSVHYEHDVLITDGPPQILTHGLEDLPDVVG